MTINERIKKLRKSMSLNQTDFGEKIGIKVSQASYIEKAGNSVTPRIVQLICNAFNVSEKWLLEGTGKMYTSSEDAIMEKVARLYDLTPEQEIFARKWLQLPADAREAVVDYVVSVAESLKENDGTKKDAPADAPAQDTECPPVAVFAPTPTAQQDAAPLAKLTDGVTDGANSLAKLTAQQDEPRPDGLSDKEWALVLMSREEEEKGSQTSSLNESERA